MSLRYLLDTNAISELNREHPDPRVQRKFEENAGFLAAATISWHEMLYGLRRMPESRRRRSVETFLSDFVRPFFVFLPYTLEAAAWHADERARLKAEGLTPSFADGQIAAVAATNGLVLVTDNRRDFAAFRNLRVESWKKG